MISGLPISASRFVYVTYIRTTPEKLWRTLLGPEFARRYWARTWQESEWKAGSSWRITIPDGRVGDSGEVVEIEPGRRLVLTWRNEFMPELRQERLLAQVDGGQGAATACGIARGKKSRLVTKPPTRNVLVGERRGDAPPRTKNQEGTS